MINQELLFNQGILRDFLQQRESKLMLDIESQEERYILEVDIQKHKQYLIKKYQLIVPKLNENKIFIDKSKEKVDISQDRRRIIINRNKPFYINGLKLICHIPFEGDSRLFKYKTTHYTLNPPRGEVFENEIVVNITELDHNTNSVKKEFEQNFNKIKKWLDWVNQEVSQYNDSLDTKIEQKIKLRKDKLIKDQNLIYDLGFPLKKRENTIKTYSVPTIKRKLKLSKPLVTTSSIKVEPTISIDEYDNILEIINNMASVMERSPQAFATMDEESIRQHFLVQLNGQYEGQATGETFNFKGKTDILIRVENKNIFIAECKFWKGKKQLIETIDQILNYISWRDTKTAIIIFNRNKDLSNIIKQIPEIVKEHPNFKKELKYNSETGFRFIINNKNDSERDLYLTILIFEVPK